MLYKNGHIFVVKNGKLLPITFEETLSPFIVCMSKFRYPFEIMYAINVFIIHVILYN